MPCPIILLAGIQPCRGAAFSACLLLAVAAHILRVYVHTRTYCECVAGKGANLQYNSRPLLPPPPRRSPYPLALSLSRQFALALSVLNAVHDVQFFGEPTAGGGSFTSTVCRCQPAHQLGSERLGEILYELAPLASRPPACLRSEHTYGPLFTVRSTSGRQRRTEPSVEYSPTIS